MASLIDSIREAILFDRSAALPACTDFENNSLPTITSCFGHISLTRRSPRDEYPVEDFAGSGHRSEYARQSRSASHVDALSAHVYHHAYTSTLV